MVWIRQKFWSSPKKKCKPNWIKDIFWKKCLGKNRNRFLINHTGYCWFLEVTQEEFEENSCQQMMKRAAAFWAYILEVLSTRQWSEMAIHQDCFSSWKKQKDNVGFNQSLRWKLGEQASSFGSILAYLEAIIFLVIKLFGFSR